MTGVQTCALPISTTEAVAKPATIKTTSDLAKAKAGGQSFDEYIKKDAGKLQIPSRIQEIAKESEKYKTVFDKEQGFINNIEKEYGKLFDDNGKINFTKFGITDKKTKDFIGDSWEDLYTYAKDPQLKYTSTVISKLKAEWDKAPEATVKPPEQVRPILDNGKRVTKGAYEMNLKREGDGYDKLPPEQQAQYDPKPYKEARVKVAKLMDENMQSAKDMALTGKDIPKDIPSEILFNEVRKAQEALPKSERDYQFLADLQKSPIHTKVSEAAQTLGGHGYSKGDVSSTDYIDKAKKATRNERVHTKTMGKARATISRAAARMIDYNKIIDKITC